MFPTGALKKFQSREISITVGRACRVSFVDEKRAQVLSVGLTNSKKNPGIHQSSFDVAYYHINTEFTVK